MNTEVEIKAHVDDADSLKKAISAMGSGCVSLKKEDAYWKTKDGKSVRIRKEERVDSAGAHTFSRCVTFKEKETRDSMEVNRETEFFLPHEADFEALLLHLGLEMSFCKEKSGFLWTIDGMNVELMRVTGAFNGKKRDLGYFLEAEVLLSPSAAPSEIENARKKLEKLLADCGIGAEKVETRYYEEMIRAGCA